MWFNLVKPRFARDQNGLDADGFQKNSVAQAILASPSRPLAPPPPHKHFLLRFTLISRMGVGKKSEISLQTEYFDPWFLFKIVDPWSYINA